jgi:hypothetical protein
VKESPLKQRVFDQLFSGLALCALLDRQELRDIAHGLNTQALDPGERPMWCAVAQALEAYANAEAQA